MCVYSMIADDWTRRTYPVYPWIDPIVHPNTPSFRFPPTPAPSQEEFDSLRREVEALKKLLQAAKIYDAETGQPDCETDEKIGDLKRIADLLGVDLSDALPEVQS